MLQKPCFQLLFLDKMSLSSVMCHQILCYFLCFDLLLLTLRYHEKIKRKVRFNWERHCFTLIFTLYISPSIKRWIILCSIRQDFIKHISSARHQFSLPNVIVSLSNQTRTVQFVGDETKTAATETNQNVIFSPQVVKTPVQDRYKFIR